MCVPQKFPGRRSPLPLSSAQRRGLRGSRWCVAAEPLLFVGSLLACTLEFDSDNPTRNVLLLLFLQSRKFTQVETALSRAASNEPGVCTGVFIQASLGVALPLGLR